MIRGSLTAVARAVGGTLLGADARFSGVSTDTRSLSPGQLFVALSGPRFDGHDFVAAAAERGAVAAVVERPLDTGVPTLRVADTLAALGAMANWWRRQFTLPVIALTGSFGKTTVKEMLAAIARTRGETLATTGNLNNEIGVPLTLFRLGEEHATAVVEMGANHQREIARLTAITQPDVGLVTVAGPAHLEGFGSLEGVARGKGEIFQGLPGDGVAVINADDPFAPMWREFAGDRRVDGRRAGDRFRASRPGLAPARDPAHGRPPQRQERPGRRRRGRCGGLRRRCHRGGPRCGPGRGRPALAASRPGGLHHRGRHL
ncbi:MAG: Mur ligase family protein [Gammaproteobacteria bacterium]